MFILENEKALQRFFLFIGTSFFFFLVAVAVYRSLGRKSIWATTGKGGEENSVLTFFDQPKAGTSEIRLQDFHRVEVKNGRPVWEVNAKEAKYYAQQGLTHVNDAALVIYRSNDSNIEVHSTAARLYLERDAFQRAELEGEIQVKLGKDLQLKTGLATYSGKIGGILAPERVIVEGEGFEIRAIGLQVELQTNTITFLSQVESRFEPHSHIPVVKTKAQAHSSR